MYFKIEKYKEDLTLKELLGVVQYILAHIHLNLNHNGLLGLQH